jgi:hypothetical protein
MGTGFVHIKMTNTRKRPAPAPCVARIERSSIGQAANNSQNNSVRSCAISSYLCDWTMDDGRTCDAPLCPEHAHEIGPDRHLCGLHFALHGAEQG